MPLLKYPYLSDIFVDRITKKVNSHFRPYIPLRLGYGQHTGKVAVNCLLDSGADRNLFPSDWGRNLGINIKKGIAHDHLGIGGYGIRAYTHKVYLYLGTHKLSTEVDFSDFQNTPLLGRDGFFNLFDYIKISHKHKLIEIKY